MAHDVFISHSSKDKVMADAICAGLEARGIRCWITPRDVQPGEEWTKAIVDAITSCKIFLLVFSDNANTSSQIIKEVDCATSDEKTIIPFRTEDVKPTGSMKYYLGSLHWLDAITPPMEKQINKLADYISHIIGLPKPGEESESPVIVKQNKHTNADTQSVIERPTSPNIKHRNKVGLFIGLGVLLIGILLSAIYLFNGQLFLGNSPAPTLTVTPRELVITPTSTNATITPTVATKVSPRDGMTMLLVPAGEFLMGSSEGIGDERPQHTVYLDDFWIDQTEVTNRMYMACVNTGFCITPSIERSSRRDNYFGSNQFANYPVIYVNWNQANSYCEWSGRRLPTEAEWEKAARGMEGGKYPWGDQSPESELSNYAEIVGDTTEVGTYENGASPYSALDMAGNVWEWVSDWYGQDYYKLSPINNPQGPTIGSYRGIRGGSWAFDIQYLLTTYRGWVDPNISNHNIGFRCAQSE